MKKVLKWLMVIVIGLFLVVLLPGLIQPSHSTETSYVVNASRNIVYTQLINPLNMKNWMKGLDHVDYGSGIPGFPGNTMELTFVSNGEKIVIEEEILRNSPGKLLELHYRHQYLEGTITIELSENATRKTAMNVRNSYHGHHWYQKSLLVFLAGKIDQTISDNFSTFQSQFEDA